MVAIGSPTDRLPAIGAARMYYDDEHWRDGVLGLLRQAELVVIHAGETTGLHWELEQVGRLVHPNRIILSLPRASARTDAVDVDRYLRFRERTTGMFPQPLPDIPGGEFLYFDDDWTPQFIGGRRSRREPPRVARDPTPRGRAIDALSPWFKDRPLLYGLRIAMLIGLGLGLLWLWGELGGV